MKDYALFYSYKTIGDVLLVVFDNSLKPTSKKTINKITVIYNEDKIIGYNIFDIKDIVRIRSNGLIYYPSEQFLNVVNSMLKNAGLPILEKKENSGYFIGEVESIDGSIVEIRGNEELLATCNQQLKVGNKIVYATVGTYLNNGEVVKEANVNGKAINGHICTNRELGINDDDNILLLEEDDKVGTDFFSLEESL